MDSIPGNKIINITTLSAECELLTAKEAKHHVDKSVHNFRGRRPINRSNNTTMCSNMCIPYASETFAPDSIFDR